uniref:Uncharacterized protein n=1 Tax=Moniliophthora roreri TaxID=221103 RepID=A0A0W0GC22_MONRR
MTDTQFFGFTPSQSRGSLPEHVEVSQIEFSMKDHHWYWDSEWSQQPQMELGVESNAEEFENESQQQGTYEELMLAKLLNGLSSPTVCYSNVT